MPPRIPQLSPLAKRLLWGIIPILICGAVFFSTPGKSAWLPPCIFYKLTGIYCPGCGNTRALHALLHGELLRSLHNNLLLIPAILLLALLFFKPNLTLHPTLCKSVAVVVILFWILRNLPCFPFTLLAPLP